MKTIKEYKKNPLVSLILVIFCFVSAAVGFFFALNRVFANIEHDKKWQEYDECGIF